MPWGCWFLADLVPPSELGSPASPDVSSRLRTLTSKSTQGALTWCKACGSELYLRRLATLCLYPLHMPLGRSFISFSSPALQALALTKCLWNGYSNTRKDVRIRKRLCLSLCTLSNQSCVSVQYNVRGEALFCSPLLFQYKAGLA